MVTIVELLTHIDDFVFDLTAVDTFVGIFGSTEQRKDHQSYVSSEEIHLLVREVMASIQ